MIDLQFLSPENMPKSALEKDELSIRREILLQRVLNTLLIILTVGLPALALLYASRLGSWAAPLVLSYLAILVVTIARRINFHLRALAIILTFQVLGVISTIQYGMSGPGPLLLFGAAILANMFYSPRIGGLLAAISAGSLVTVGVLLMSHVLPFPKLTAAYFYTDVAHWMISIVIFVFLIILVMTSIMTLVNGLVKSLAEQRRLSTQLQEEQSSLERRVDERAADLKNRLNQFEIASQIAREISGETNLENLLNNAVNQIRDRFGFYHVGIFLNDEHEEYSVLRAATGEAGRQMLERNHQLKIGEMGMVGYTASRGEARISLDVTGDMVHYKNPLLPATRSEMALPLRSAGKTIGALDVQSVLENAFSLEDVRILQTIADQLAIAFEKTRLVEQMQNTVKELEASYHAATQKAWRTHLRNTRQRLSYRYVGNHLENYADESAQGKQAMQQGRSVLKTSQQLINGKQVEETVLAVPIRLRNQVLGVVDIRFESGNVSPDLISLIEGTVNRLAVSMENTRLLEEIQFRAERERLVSEISSKVRSASDVDSVLQTAIQEIGRSLGVSEVMVQLRKEY